MSDPTRRGMLRTAGGVAGTMGVAGVAGCSSLPLLGGGEGTTEYADWFYEPAAVGREKQYEFFTMDAGAIREHEDELPAVFRVGIRDSLSASGLRETIGMGFDELEWFLLFDNTEVLTGQYDLNEVESRLTDAGYEKRELRGGYTLLAGAGGDVAVGVRDEDLLRATAPTSDTTPLERLRATIAAKRGDENRYADTSEDMRTLTDELGSGDLVRGGLGDPFGRTNVEVGVFEGRMGSGIRLRLDGATTAVHGVILFAEESDVDVAAVEEYLQHRQNPGSSEGLGNAESFEVRESGRAAIYDLEAETAAIRDFL